MMDESPVKMVLLHPLPLDGSIWPTDLWAIGPDVLAPTMYGYGDTIEDWAKGVLADAGSGPLILIGNSIGGSCAIEIARLAPERVHLLMLIGAKAGHRPESRVRYEAVQLLRDGGTGAAWPKYWAPLFAPDADPIVAERARLIAEAQDPEDVVRGVRVFHGRSDRDHFLRSFEGPVVIVRGEHDRVPADADRLASELRDGSFVCVNGAGHYVPLEQPEVLTQLVRTAIDQARPSSS